MTDGDDKLRLRLHLASGKSLDVIVDDNPELQDVEDYLEERIGGKPGEPGYAKPRWTWIGPVLLYTQTIEGVEIL